MDSPVDVARRLWTLLEGLAEEVVEDARTVATVLVRVQGGATLEVFRADRVDAAVVAWRVRGFTDAGVRLAAILGTTDGRAMLTAADQDDTPPLGGLVVDAALARRDIADLSDAIAKAIRARLGEPARGE